MHLLSLNESFSISYLLLIEPYTLITDDWAVCRHAITNSSSCLLKSYKLLLFVFVWQIASNFVKIWETWYSRSKLQFMLYKIWVYYNSVLYMLFKYFVMPLFSCKAVLWGIPVLSCMPYYLVCQNCFVFWFCILCHQCLSFYNCCQYCMSPNQCLLCEYFWYR